MNIDTRLDIRLENTEAFSIAYGMDWSGETFPRSQREALSIETQKTFLNSQDTQLIFIPLWASRARGRRAGRRLAGRGRGRRRRG